jgi:hypothetical protein
MTAYNVALFIHLLGAITFFLAIGITQRGGAGMRRAESVEHIRWWADLVQTTQRMWPAAIIMLLGAGLYMTFDVWTFTTPWIVVAIVGLVLVIVVGTAVAGRRLEKIHAAAEAAGGGSTPPELRRLIDDPVTWLAISANNGAALGILWLMAAKPGWAWSITVVTGLALIGGLVGSAVLRRNGQRPATQS